MYVEFGFGSILKLYMVLVRFAPRRGYGGTWRRKAPPIGPIGTPEKFLLAPLSKL